MRRTTSKLILSVFSLIAARAQSASPPSFDVASVKPSPPTESDLLNINLGTLSHGVVTLGNTTLSECIRYAYGLVSEDQINGPDWIRDRSLRVDIMAKTSPDTPVDQVLLMMQTLLAQRFHLELHREPKPLRHFELAVAKNGPKIHESQEGAPATNKNYGRGRLIYDHLSMHTLAVLLSRQMQQPVIDLTALKGFYDIHLEWTPDDPSAKEAQLDGALRREGVDGPPQPDIYKAVQEQLGLLLEPKKTPIDILVIDHADKVPIAN
jgi:uncharacterized protein (TIGR03435 family)